MTTKIIVSTRNPADILTNVVSVSPGDREGTSRIVIQVTKTVQRALQVNDDAILRHVSTGDNKGSVLLRDFATSVEFKAATVQHVDNGFIVHADDDKSVFFNSAFSSYVAEGKPSVSEDDEEENPAAKTTKTKAKTTAKAPAKTAAKTATKKKVDVEDEGDVEEDVEAEEEKPAKTTKAKTAAKAPAKTAAKKKVADNLIDDEDGEDDVEVEEKPAKTAKAKTTAKTAAKTTAAKAKTTKAKPEIADDADDWGDDE